MKRDFEVLNKPYVPLWRASRPRKAYLLLEAVMALASGAGLLLVATPWRGLDRLDTAISVQLAQGDLAARALFVFMGFVLVAMAVRLWRAQRKASALFMVAEVAALAYLARTEPHAIDHLLTFVAVSVASAGWLVVLAIDLEDPWLSFASVGGILALALIPVSLGLGERALIASCLVGMNLMFFRHFD